MAVDDGNRDDNLEWQPQLARLVEAAGGEEPPAALDAAILATARREVSARPQVVGGGGEAASPVPRQKRNWYVPLSIAAVLVMSVSLVTLVHQEKGDELTQPPRVAKESAPAAAAPPAAEPKLAELPRDAVAAKSDTTLRDTAPVLTAKVEAEKRAQTVPPAVVESSDSYAQKQRNEAAQPDAVTGVVKPLAKAASPAVPPAPVRPDAPPVVAVDRPAAVMSRKLGAPETGAAVGTVASEASVTVARREAPGSQGERAPADVRQEKDAVGQVARDRQRDASGRLDRAGAGSAPNPGAVASPPAAPPPSRESKALAEPFPAAVTRESAQPRVSAAPPPAAESRNAAASPAPAPAAKPAQQRSGPQQMTRPAWFTELDNQPPEKWLERLAQFKRDGRQVEADELIIEFRRRFPDHPGGAR